MCTWETFCKLLDNHLRTLLTGMRRIYETNNLGLFKVEKNNIFDHQFYSFLYLVREEVTSYLCDYRKFAPSSSMIALKHVATIGILNEFYWAFGNMRRFENNIYIYVPTVKAIEASS